VKQAYFRPRADPFGPFQTQARIVCDGTNRILDKTPPTFPKESLAAGVRLGLGFPQALHTNVSPMAPTLQCAPINPNCRMDRRKFQSPSTITQYWLVFSQSLHSTLPACRFETT